MFGVTKGLHGGEVSCRPINKGSSIVRAMSVAPTTFQPGDLPELPPFLADAIQTLVLYCTRADKESVMAAIERCMDRHSNIVTLACAARRDILFRRLLVQLPIFTQSPIDQGT